MDAERIVNSDAAAKQRCSLFAHQAVGNRNHEAGIRANAVRIAAVAMDAGTLGIGAKVFHAPQAPLTLSAGVRLPPEAHALVHLEGAHFAAQGSNGSDHFVARNERILTDA